MKISVIPASTQAGKATIEALLRHQSPPQIRAIYRNIAKAPAEFTAHAAFEAVHGGLDDGMALDFADSDAVFYIPPPTYDDAIDSGEHATKSANKVKAALEKAPKVQRLVIFSAMGGQHSEGVGILKINHITELILEDSAAEVIIARPGWFNENWAEALETSKRDDSFFETHFTPAEQKIAMISLVDVSNFILQRLLETGTALSVRPQVYTLHGPRSYSMLDLQEALAEVAGKKPRIEAVEQEKLLDFFKTKLPPTKAQEVTEMTVAINGGGLLAKEMSEPSGNVVRGSTELVETLRQLNSGQISKNASGAF